MDDLEKLRHLIQHWIDHNEAHVKTYNEWVRKTESLGEKKISGIIKKIAEESKRLEDLFKEALKNI
jgi:hypothetical protein